MKIKYDLMLMKQMALFEKISKVRPKDAFEDDNGVLHFIVNKGFIIKAIGKKGITAKKISEALKKRIKIIEFDNVRETFIKRLLFPLKVSEIESENNIVKIKAIDNETRGKIIGRNGSNLRNYEKIVKRFFEIDEIKVM
ncbi:MAG: NusA-like transcription termination signal-binding factor [Candidatus Woesearchaeota archaeon]